MLEDVADGYVTIRRAALDYGVVVEEVDAELAEYRLDAEAARASCATSVRDGSTRTPRTSPAASATASSTCSTSSATTA